MKGSQHIFSCAICLCSLLFSSSSLAVEGDFLHHQGIISDNQGRPLNGTERITFRLYAGPASTEVLWEEEHQPEIQNGLYSVDLGSAVAIPDHIFSEERLHLGISVGDDAEMRPRLAVQSVPRARHASLAKMAIRLHPHGMLQRVILEGAGEVIDAHGRWVGPPLPIPPGNSAGPAGPIGPQGPVGPVGPVGPRGADGAAGIAGPAGPVGPAGATGQTGAVGPIGPQGPAGPVGPVGPRGAEGAAGAAGSRGADGLPGSVGPAGPVGPIGPIGPVGPRGADGLAGPAGQTGATGATGPTGLAGPIGPQGPVGAVGPQGAIGPAGPQGPIGGGLYVEKSSLYARSSQSAVISLARRTLADGSAVARCDDANDIAISGGCSLVPDQWARDLFIALSGSSPVSWEDTGANAGWQCGAHGDNETGQDRTFRITATVYCIAVQ